MWSLWAPLPRLGLCQCDTTAEPSVLGGWLGLALGHADVALLAPQTNLVSPHRPLPLQTGVPACVESAQGISMRNCCSCELSMWLPGGQSLVGDSPGLFVSWLCLPDTYICQIWCTWTCLFHICIAVSNIRSANHLYPHHNHKSHRNFLFCKLHLNQEQLHKNIVLYWWLVSTKGGGMTAIGSSHTFI